MIRSIKNLIASVMISISVFFSWSSILPEYEYISQLHPVIEGKINLFQSRQEIATNLERLGKEFKEKQDEIQRLALVVPEKHDLSEFISGLEDVTLGSGVNLGELKIAKGGGLSEDLFSTINMEASVASSYELILTFLNNLEKNIRLIDITSFGISIDESSKEGEIGNQISAANIPLNLGFKSKSYYLNSNRIINSGTSGAKSADLN